MEKTITPTSIDTQVAPQTSKYRSPINLNSKLDDFALDPYEFRVYGHVARRAGKSGECFSRVEDMASVCKMSTRKVRYSLRFLCEAGLLLEQKKPNRKTVTYKLAPMESWAENQDLEAIRSQVKNSKPQDEP